MKQRTGKISEEDIDIARRLLLDERKKRRDIENIFKFQKTVIRAYFDRSKYKNYQVLPLTQNIEQNVYNGKIGFLCTNFTYPGRYSRFKEKQL